MMYEKSSLSPLFQLGYKPIETKLISTTEPGRDGVQVKGFFSTETGGSYVNDKYNNSNYELLKTSATEGQRAMDAQKGSTFNQNDEYRADRSAYSQNFGSNVANYTDFALYYTNQGSLSTSANSVSVPNQVTSMPSVFNNQVANNNIEFAGLDKSKGDNFGLQGAAIGGGAEIASQVSIKLATQLYKNGGDWKKIDYWAIAKSIDYVDVAEMAAIGALTPNELSSLNSLNKTRESWSAYQKYGTLAEKATKNAAKQEKFEKKAIENRNVILQEAAKQSAILGLKLGVKSLNDTGDKQ